MGSAREPDEPPSGQPAVDDDSGASELLGNARGSAKKSVAMVSLRAKGFLEAVKAGTLERLKREELFIQLAEVVFAYWAARLHHPKALLDRKRDARLRARLRESGGDWGLLLYAVDGALSDDWIMGRDERSARPYDGIETIFRDRAQVERLAELCPRCRRGEPHPLVAKYQNGNGHAAP